MLTDLERGEGRKEQKESKRGVREEHRLVAFPTHPDWDGTHSTGMCPDQELNPQPCGLLDNIRPTEPYQPGQV